MSDQLGEYAAGQDDLISDPADCLHRNWDLHVTSSCHRIKIYSINKSKAVTAQRLKALEKANIPMIPITHPLEIDLESQEHYDKAMAKRRGRDPKL